MFYENFSTDIYEEALSKLTDFENFNCVNKAYSDLSPRFFEIVNKMTTAKTIIVQNNANEWFDGVSVEKIAARDKLFRKF